jgi:hypothetical protein
VHFAAADKGELGERQFLDRRLVRRGFDCYGFDDELFHDGFPERVSDGYALVSDLVERDVHFAAADEGELGERQFLDGRLVRRDFDFCGFDDELFHGGFPEQVNDGYLLVADLVERDVHFAAADEGELGERQFLDGRLVRRDFGFCGFDDELFHDGFPELVALT